MGGAGEFPCSLMESYLIILLWLLYKYGSNLKGFYLCIYPQLPTPSIAIINAVLQYSVLKILDYVELCLLQLWVICVVLYTYQFTVKLFLCQVYKILVLVVLIVKNFLKK